MPLPKGIELTEANADDGSVLARRCRTCRVTEFVHNAGTEFAPRPLSTGFDKAQFLILTETDRCTRCRTAFLVFDILTPSEDEVPDSVEIIAL